MATKRCTPRRFDRMDRLDILWARAYTQRRDAPLTIPLPPGADRDFFALRVFLTEYQMLNNEPDGWGAAS